MATTATNQQLYFLQEKIKEIGSAIFFNLSDSVLKLPTSIVKTLKVDDYGYVWFFIKKPQQCLAEFEAEFPVRLDFFKKGTSAFMQVSGKSRVVTDPEELSGFSNHPEAMTEDTVLLKVKMMKAEYYEPKAKRPVSWWQNAVNTLSAWFGNSHGYRPDIYYPAS